MPGRTSRAADLATVAIADCVDSVVADVESAGLGDVVVVGHSLAGVTVPGVVAKLGSSRVREMILVGAFVPPQGSAVLDVLRGPLATFARRLSDIRATATLPAAVARYAFCNGMTREQRRFTLSRICGDGAALVTTPIDRSNLPADVPRTWIMTLNDRALSARQQLDSIKTLGGVDNLIPIAACHDVMISHPRWLATVLAERCRAYA
ncbi:MAG: alpha/beta fold hydrolase [Mycobacteriaceae bacterium]|nr:alpha/beta fold hydrolase [Mycobacteriaceae bacterium]